MREIYRAICATIVLALPFAAAAQSTNAFDGTYRGVSLTVAKNNGNNPYREGRCPPPAPTPPTLRIAHGEVHAGPFHGTVSPEGVSVGVPVGPISTTWQSLPIENVLAGIPAPLAYLSVRQCLALYRDGLATLDIHDELLIDGLILHLEIRLQITQARAG